MKILFNDPSFSFETLRTLGFACDGGADLGEIIITASKIPDGDEDAWLREWKTLADRIAQQGEDSLSKGHHVSAREAFLRASNYYRVAEFYRRFDPVNDQEVISVSRLSRETFQKAALLLDTPVENVLIPYEDVMLPAYFFKADATDSQRPTIIYNNGFDSTREEAYFAIAAAALRRGYNVLAFDGPGAGEPLREDNMLFRVDWEAVITPVLDYTYSRKDVCKDQIALFGYSLGALQIVRAAAFDSRVGALILNDGMYDFYDANTIEMPPFLLKLLDNGQGEIFDQVIRMLMKNNTSLRWAIQNGLWTFGATTPSAYLKETKAWTLDGFADKVKAPTLVLEAEEDKFLQGQAQKVVDSLLGATTLVKLYTSEGAGEHCHEGAMRRLTQIIFDWLDETFSNNIH
ncbi:alpha/beta hydrolase family protein [uncultured Bacteroides sp.]|uniref:alpha/beta hydrolase family protein n=1 Tax=uncultured Bacteroides sp. TaxID=162156 RepID=UPI002AA956EA|nr:alpha/beta hydrolase family protein [uncultured Bacteroides sp.]